MKNTITVRMTLDEVQELVERRLKLCENVPPCPSCGETDQIQLVEWIEFPVQWRCRVCNHKWEQHEKLL